MSVRFKQRNRCFYKIKNIIINPTKSRCYGFWSVCVLFTWLWCKLIFALLWLRCQSHWQFLPDVCVSPMGVLVSLAGVLITAHTSVRSISIRQSLWKQPLYHDWLRRESAHPLFLKFIEFQAFGLCNMWVIGCTVTNHSPPVISFTLDV